MDKPKDYTSSQSESDDLLSCRKNDPVEDLGFLTMDKPKNDTSSQSESDDLLSCRKNDPVEDLGFLTMDKPKDYTSSQFESDDLLSCRKNDPVEDLGFRSMDKPKDDTSSQSESHDLQSCRRNEPVEDLADTSDDNLEPPTKIKKMSSPASTSCRMSRDPSTINAPKFPIHKPLISDYPLTGGICPRLPPAAVFLDVENVAVPYGVSGIDFANMIRERFIKSQFSERDFITTVDANTYPELILRELSLVNVGIFHIAVRKPNAGDFILMERMQKFSDAYSHVPGAAIILIASDRDYAASVTKFLYRHSIRVIVGYGSKNQYFDPKKYQFTPDAVDLSIALEALPKRAPITKKVEREQPIPKEKQMVEDNKVDFLIDEINLKLRILAITDVEALQATLKFLSTFIK